MSRPESRRSYLMERAIEALDAYHDPLGSPFLVQHDVSLDETSVTNSAQVCNFSESEWKT
jgi:hypothetical protein